MAESDEAPAAGTTTPPEGESGSEPLTEATPAVSNEDAGGQNGQSAQNAEEEADTLFDRAYVEKLRKESARYREQARNADAHAQRLHTELVRATRRLADPTDLPFDAAHLDDPEALAAAVDDLLAKKPHLAARRPMGDIGQGATSTAAPVDLAGMLRQRA